MKRVLSLILTAFLLLSLIACQSDPAQTKTTQEDAFSGLSAEEVYRKAYSNQAKLSSSSYVTTVLISGEEKDTIQTVRVRRGFDDFCYSRTSLAEQFYFDTNQAVAIGPSGAFRAPASSRSFQSFLDTFVFPVVGQNPDALTDFVREGNRVSYTVKDQAQLALFSRIHLPEDNSTFTATALSGTATVSGAGYFSAEEMHLTGSVHRADGDSEIKLSLSTALVKVKSEEITALPIPEETYVEVDDLSRVFRLDDALQSLKDSPTLSVMQVTSETVQTADKRLSLDTNAVLYQTSTGAFSSVQSLRRGLAEQDENWVEETLLSGTTRHKAVFDGTTAELLSDEETSDTSISLWPASSARVLLTLSDIASLPAQDGVTDADTAFFTLSRTAVDRLKNSLAPYFPESGLEQTTLSSFDGSGNITMKNGKVSGISYSYNGTFSGGTVTGIITISLEENDSTTLPEIQPPAVGDASDSAGGHEH